MQKFLIGLSVIIGLFFNGCATSSAPSPKVSTHEESHEKLSNEASKYKKACDLNDGKACEKLGSIYTWGKGFTKNNIKAKKYYTKACDLNIGSACTTLSGYYSREENNKSKSRMYSKKACDLNDGAGCLSLGSHTMLEAKSAQEVHKAKEYYKKACDLKHDIGCYMYKNTIVKYGR